MLEGNHPLEPAEHHALAVERHRLRIHHVREPRILHRLRVHTIAILARFVNDPREPHLFALLELHALREGSVLADFDVVSHALVVTECAVVRPNLAGLQGHLLVLVAIAARYRNHESVDIGHDSSPWPNCSAASRAYNSLSRSNCSCRPVPTMRPWSITTIRSELIAVASRCAITIVVRLRIRCSRASCTTRSLSESSELVASSSSRIGGF